MNDDIIKEGKFEYIHRGEGVPVVLLHGLLGDISNFDRAVEALSANGYSVYLPILPLYSLSILKTTVKGMMSYIREFIEAKGLEKPILIGNSLGGHIALVYTKAYMGDVRALVLTGSSGLYENSFGSSFPKRGDYEYIDRKTREVFYNPKIVSKEFVDSIFKTVNNRLKALHTISLSKSAIRHNMEKDLPAFNLPVCLIWGRNDIVTPPDVAETFHRILPDSDLFWIDQCGHAPMMECSVNFNEILLGWLHVRKLDK